MDKYTIIKSKELKVLDKSRTPKIEDCYLLQFDGLAAPNPGQCTGGAVLYGPESEGSRDTVFEAGHYLNFGTNNQGEYIGLFIGVQGAVKTEGLKNLLIEGDSMLVIQQIIGNYKVKDKTLKILHEAILKLFKNFDFVGIRHVYRKDNVRADELTNETLSSKESFFRTL